MWDAIKNWQAVDVIVLVMVIGMFLTAIVVSVAVSWGWVRREEIRANLKRDMLERGLSVEQVERLIRAPHQERPPVEAKEFEAQFASLLVQNEVSAPTMERVLRVFQETDPLTKKAVYDSLEEIVGSSPSEEQLIAAVKALCPARASTLPTDSQFAPMPAAV
jgi:hypothetical protein